MASVAALLAIATLGHAATITTTEPAMAAIEQARATTVPQTWTSNVTGKVFDRFYQIWLENVVCIDGVIWPAFIKDTDIVSRTLAPQLRMTIKSGLQAKASLC